MRPVVIEKFDEQQLDKHPWMGVDRRTLQDCVLLAAIAISCVGLMVLAAI